MYMLHAGRSPRRLSRVPTWHQVDHKIPLAIGGKHCAHNLQILSEAEHLKKTTKEDAGNIAALNSVWRAMGYRTDNRTGG